MMLEEPFFYWELRTCHQFLQGENEHANLSNGVNRGQVPVQYLCCVISTSIVGTLLWERH